MAEQMQTPVVDLTKTVKVKKEKVDKAPKKSHHSKREHKKSTKPVVDLKKTNKKKKSSKSDVASKKDLQEEPFKKAVQVCLYHPRKRSTLQFLLDYTGRTTQVCSGLFLFLLSLQYAGIDF